MLPNCMCVTCVGKAHFVIFECLVIHMQFFHQREQDTCELLLGKWTLFTKTFIL
jgi:hypothetical protein